MVFEHLVFTLTEYNENNQDGESDQIYILLNDNVDDDNDRIIAQAISLDIRGDFGFFLNRLIDETSKGIEYEWTGNLFHIIINANEHVVKIIDLTDKEDHVYYVDLDQWQEALLDWKQFYLKTLGFLEFNSVALSHMMGVLILTYDQIDGNFYSYEMLTEAINKCSKRYGVPTSVIYRDCRKVTGLYDIRQFFAWAIGVFNNKYRCDFLHDFVLNYLYGFYEDIRPSILKHLNIKL
jgi:hypothetical protein